MASAKDNFQNIIPIVFATDDNYFPYMAVSIQSVMENADSSRMFKIYVLCQTLREDYKLLLQKQMESYTNFTLAYLDVSKHFEKYVVRNLRYTTTSLFRLIIPYIFTEYKHVIWLDVDTTCLVNVADLWLNTNDDCMLKCTKDVGVLAVIRNHAKKIGLQSYQNYFSAGVLVFNVAFFRKNTTFDAMMQLERQKKMPFADQEILNIVCENKVQYVSMNWNVMCGKCKTYKNPKIIHYVWDKPWKSFYKTSRGKYFWTYAKRTPFYDIVVEKSKRKSLKNIAPLAKYYVVSLFAKFLSANKTANC